MDRLPVDEVMGRVVAAVRSGTGAVVVAPPGAGKTTRVPPSLLHAGILKDGEAMVMLQPRRVAARAAAARIAAEQGWRLGEEVGYQVRFEKVMGPRTRITVVTEGILGRQLLEDPYLEGVGCLLLDEFHERSLHTDLAIAMLRELQQTVRPELKIVVMSATMEAEPVARFLGGVDVVRSEGRLWPVEVAYKPAGDAKLVEHVARVVAEELRAENSEGKTGDVLVFLPGVEEIRRVRERIAGMVAAEGVGGGRDGVVVELHGSLTFEEQKRAIEPEPAGRRKVILATNIAETSLTIEGVRVVVDSGVARVAGFDPERGLDKLELKRISKASATQRAGRAGRTGPGRCVRLWSAQQEKHFSAYELPEVQRVDLCQAVLGLHAWGASDVRAFGWYERPGEERLAAAEGLLELLGAVHAGKLTEVGRAMLALPVHPRLARLMIAAAQARRVREGALVAALLGEKDVLRTGGPGERGPRTVAESDLIVRMGIVEEVERSGFAGFWRDRGVDLGAVRQVVRTRGELVRIGEKLGPAGSREPPAPTDERTLLKLALWAYPDRVVRRRGVGNPAGIMVDGGGIKLAAESVVVHPEFFLALNLRQDARGANQEAMVTVASAIEASWLEEMFPDQLRHEQGVVFDPDRQRVAAVKRIYYRDLLLAEDRHGPIDPQLAAAALGEALRDQASDWFARDEAAANFLARLALARHTMPERPWPTMDAQALGDLLAGTCAGKRTVDDVRAVSLVSLLQGALVYPLDRLLEEQVPEAIEVPSGSRIRLDYTPAQRGEPPVLAVRLQELFGLAETPRICGGRVKLVVHLLGPNYRPVQITDDLASFWRGAYFEVRKDLRVRYPRHAWPENPLTARPEAKGGRKR